MNERYGDIKLYIITNVKLFWSEVRSNIFQIDVPNLYSF